MIIVVSAAIWCVQLRGAGRMGAPVLTQMAEFIGGVWSNVVKNSLKIIPETVKLYNFNGGIYADL